MLGAGSWSLAIQTRVCFSEHAHHVKLIHTITRPWVLDSRARRVELGVSLSSWSAERGHSHALSLSPPLLQDYRTNE